MTAEQRKSLVTSIIQGGTRKLLRGEKPFNPIPESDPRIEVFQQKLSALAPRVGLDFDALVDPIIHELVLKS
jgi:hypothetical protein